MKKMKSVMSLLVLVLVVGLCFFTASSFAAGNAAGKKVFLDTKCNKCHTLKNEGIQALPKEASAESDDEEAGEKAEPKDLSKLEDAVLKTKATPDESLKAWLKKEVEVSFKAGEPAKKHKKLFNGPDADLTALINFLQGK